MKSTELNNRISKLRITGFLVGLALTVSVFTATYAARIPEQGNSLADVAAVATSPAVAQGTSLSTATAASTQSTSTSLADATSTQIATGTATSGPAAASSTTGTSSSTSAAPAALVAAAAPTASSSTEALPSEAVISDFPALEQAYSLSCEYAAASPVTLYWGNQVSEDVFVSQVPGSLNPHLGFRGNINAAFGGINNYGVYAEALVPVLEANGYDATVFYGGVDRLKANIAAGNPVEVWITVGKYTKRTPVTRTLNGQNFTLVAGEHAVVIYGYDSGGVYIMDVASGSYAYTAWDSFVTRWSYFDQMALVITPR